MQVFKHHIILKILFLVLFINIMNCISIYGQNAQPATDTSKVTIDKTKPEVEPVPVQKIEDFRKNRAFQYTEEVKQGFNFWSYFWYWVNKILAAIFSDKGPAPFIRWLVVLAVLSFIIYKIFSSNISGIFSLNKKAKGANGFDYFDEDIHNHDLDKKLSQAIASQQYRDAIRYYYLKLLKYLDSSELIKWEISKTNREYQKELSDNSILGDFIILSGIYEYTWYGNFEVNQAHFNSWQVDFQSAFRQINNK